MRRFALLQLVFAATLWAVPAAAQDEPGSARVEIHLVSDQGLPEDVRDRLFDKLRVAIKCEGKKVPDSKFKVGKPKKKPEIRGLSAPELPTGDCTVLGGIDHYRARVALKIRPGKKASGKLRIEVGWARLSVDQLLDGDAAYLVWTDKKDRAKKLDLGTEPVLVTLRDYSWTLKHAGERGEPTALRGVKGDHVIRPYGTIEFSRRALIDGAIVKLDGSKVELDDGRLLTTLGKHTVELSAPGHRPVSKELTVRAGKPAKWTSRLSKARPGTFAFEISGPDEFTLTVDGAETDPTTTVRLDTGEHTIGVTSPGYEAISETITVEEREKRTLAYTLTPAPIEISVGPLPEGATVTVRARGEDPLTLDVHGGTAVATLPPGRYGVSAEAPDTVSWFQSIELGIGDDPLALTPDMPSTVVEVTWSGLPTTATIFLEESGAEPRELPVSADGTVKTRVNAGYLSWRAEARSYLTVADSVDLEPGTEPLTIEVELPIDVALRSRNRTIVMSAGAGGSGAVGLILLAAAGGSYAKATREHDHYLTSTNPDDIVTAKEARDQALAQGQTQAAVGAVLTGVGVGVAAATVVLHFLDQKKQPKQIGAIVVPTEGGAALTVTGRW